jgi:hypothetical protein
MCASYPLSAKGWKRGYRTTALVQRTICQYCGIVVEFLRIPLISGGWKVVVVVGGRISASKKRVGALSPEMSRSSLLFENKLKGAQTEEDVSSCSVMRVVWERRTVPLFTLVRVRRIAQVCRVVRTGTWYRGYY